jgi:protein subunit release factor B
MSKELVLSITRKDFEIQFFKGSGPGGQNRNKVESGVRIIHKESGAVGQAVDSRDQLANRKNAMKRLAESAKFKVWLAKKLYEIEVGKTIEKLVDEMMDDKNIKIEGIDENGKWIEIK